ncbi:MAG: prepilin-type N-terminal cleavage/methylation domain-containing protein, partial [Planctomycetota bacterium]|nr:prepilin-type N-terminal cleavage/methylation domain-containing protein [Planctomycetota bacterium]
MRMGRRAFTLLEILIAMSLFTVLGFAVVVLMRNGVDMWIRGNRGARQEDRLEQSLPRLEEDLRMVAVPNQRDRRPFDPKNPDPEKEPQPLMPDNRFISGYQNYKIRDKDYQCRFFSFVRDISGLSEIETYVLRAGRNAKADAYIDGKDDEEEFSKNNHLPTGGAVEVL